MNLGKIKALVKEGKTEWHKIVIFSPGLSEVAEKYLKRVHQFIWKTKFKLGSIQIKQELKST